MLTKEVKEITIDNLDNSGYYLFDFEKDAFSQLEIEMNGECQELAEVVIGEELENGHLVNLPASSRTYKKVEGAY